MQRGGKGEGEQAEAGAEEELAGAGEKAGAAGGDGRGGGQVEGIKSTHATTRKITISSRFIKMLLCSNFFFKVYIRPFVSKL